MRVRQTRPTLRGSSSTCSMFQVRSPALREEIPSVGAGRSAPTPSRPGRIAPLLRVTQSAHALLDSLGKARPAIPPFYRGVGYDAARATKLREAGHGPD